MGIVLYPPSSVVSSTHIMSDCWQLNYIFTELRIYLGFIRNRVLWFWCWGLQHCRLQSEPCLSGGRSGVLSRNSITPTSPKLPRPGLKETSRVCRGRHREVGIVEFGCNPHTEWLTTWRSLKRCWGRNVFYFSTEKSRTEMPLTSDPIINMTHTGLVVIQSYLHWVL